MGTPYAAPAADRPGGGHPPPSPESPAFTRVEWSALADPAVRPVPADNAAPLRVARSAADTEPAVVALPDAAGRGRLPALLRGCPGARRTRAPQAPPSLNPARPTGK